MNIIADQSGHTTSHTCEGPSLHRRFRPQSQLKLLDQCREALRFWHDSYRTEQTYLEWIERYLRFCRGISGPGGTWRHLRQCGEAEIRAFLSHLASERQVSASTQNQALNAVVFLYREVLALDLGDFSDFHRAKRSRRLPAVMRMSPRPKSTPTS